MLKERNKMREVLLHPKLSMAVAMNVIVEFQRELLASNVVSFPTIAFVGKPGTGKTPAARAVLPHESGVYLSLVNKTREVQNALDSQRGKYVLLDDYAKLTSSKGKESRNQLFDYAVRKSYDASGALLITTMETEAFQYVADSVAQRLIPIMWEEGLENCVLSELVSYMQTTNDVDLLVEYVNKYKFNHTLSGDDLYNQLQAYRKKYPSNIYTSKRTDMVFLYHWAMQILRMVWEEHFHDVLFSDEQLFELEKFYLQTNFKVGGEFSLAEEVLEYAIENGFFQPAFQYPVSKCERFVYHGCCDLFKCEHFGETDCYNDCKRVEVYSPINMALGIENEADSIVVSQYDKIPYYHKKFPMPPHLIMPAERFFITMNKALDKMVSERGKNCLYFTEQKLRRQLFDLNRIIAFPNGENGHRYTVAYPYYKNGEFVKCSCVGILLRDKEVQLLKECEVQGNGDDWVNYTSIQDAILCYKKFYTLALYCTSSSSIGVYSANMKEHKS